MVPGLQFFMFFFSLLFFTVKKTKQVSMKASKDNLKKVVDHGFKPVCLVDHVFEPSFKQQHCGLSAHKLIFVQVF